MSARKKTLYLIDGAGYYYRAFYGIRQFLSNSSGTPTNAVYGFASMLKKIIREKEPDLLLLALDSKGKTFRHDMYGDYKANRPKMPEELAQQLPLIDRLLDAQNISTIKMAGWEADDIIGALAKKGAADGYEVVIVTSDKDMAQLVEPGVSIYDSMKDKTLDSAGVIEKMGVPPERVIDLLGLMGDTSDNIPGVPGVGQKTAVALINEYGDVEQILAAAPTITKKKLKANLTKFADQARLSKQLATIATNVPVEYSPDSWHVTPPDAEKLKALYTELEFISLLREVVSDRPRPPSNYRCVLDRPAFDTMISEMRSAGAFAVDTETTSIHPTEAELVGMSFCATSGAAYYLPLRHRYEGAPTQLSLADILPDIKELLADETLVKYGHNIKYDLLVLQSEGVEIAGPVFDTMIASYLVNPGGRHGLSAVALGRLDETMIEFKDVCGSGAKQITFDKVELEPATQYAAEDADITLQLVEGLSEDLDRLDLRGLFDDMESPLIAVLASMERNGILVDANLLAIISDELAEQIDGLTKKIAIHTGDEFNPNSPKQLGEILFGKLNLPGGKKTKTGYSTGVSVLEDLEHMHELPGLMLEYRKAAKLKNTYVDALPKMINEKTGRIHTSFNQTVAATGRLSSSDPNLQNIPVRDEIGHRIRKAFIAPPGHVIVSADYSQVELRLLAHLSGEPALCEAFAAGEDIHAMTAAEVFGVNPAFVTSDMRRVAKSVNFGVIYGQTPFGLAKELKISRSDAARYIDHYFTRYPGIKGYIEKVVAETKERGYAETISGRRRYLPDINAKNRQIRQFAERNAVNTPMQGSAADLIKIAMLDIDRNLQEQNLRSKMILQVHDELLFETPEEEVEQLIAMVKPAMESAKSLGVPLVVDVAWGSSWEEAH